MSANLPVENPRNAFRAGAQHQAPIEIILKVLLNHSNINIQVNHSN